MGGHLCGRWRARRDELHAMRTELRIGLAELGLGAVAERNLVIRTRLVVRGDH